MPFLARIIAQRLFVIGLSTLAFFGINPEINIPTEEEAIVRTEERREIAKETVRGDVSEEVKEKEEEELAKEKVPIIPLPKTNILEEVRENLTKPDATRTQPPIIPSVPIKTTLPYIPPTPEIPATKITLPEVEIPETEVVKTPTKKTPDESGSGSIANATVNIVCVRHNGNKIHLSTGSGVIISPDGVVITNSHVAQHFLLDSIGYKCSLRRENIPLYGFEAEPLYISEKWIEDNFLLISSPSPSGTGEDDYALLRITKNTNPAFTLPSKFSYISPNTRADGADVGNQVTVAGYPGGRSGVFDLDSNVALETDKTSIKNVFTFSRTSVDVFSTGDTHVAKRGSSGGGVFKDGELVGVIVTTSPGYSSGNQVINALSLNYINRDLRDETGKSLSNYLSGDLKELAKSFRSSVAPHLTELLLRNL